MHRLTLHRLLSACLTGALLVLPLCWGRDSQYDYDYDSTPSPDYDDYNATFDYSFYSNTSSEDLEKFLGDSEEEDDIGEDVGEEKEEVTIKTTVAKNKACTTASPCLLLALGLTVHQLVQLL